jgi:hypothetical protein
VDIIGLGFRSKTDPKCAGDCGNRFSVVWCNGKKRQTAKPDFKSNWEQARVTGGSHADRQLTMLWCGRRWMSFYNLS